MSAKEDIEQRIWREFVGYYHNDELPRGWGSEFIEKELPKMIEESSERLTYRLDKPRISEMVGILSDLRNNRKHPLLKRIIDGSLMGWYDSEENWRIFQLIVDGIIANLDRLASSRYVPSTGE